MIDIFGFQTYLVYRFGDRCIFTDGNKIGIHQTAGSFLTEFQKFFYIFGSFRFDIFQYFFGNLNGEVAYNIGRIVNIQFVNYIDDLFGINIMKDFFAKVLVNFRYHFTRSFRIEKVENIGSVVDIEMIYYFRDVGRVEIG